MSAGTTRRAFLGGAVAFAAVGAGTAGAGLPAFVGGGKRFAARLRVDELRTTAAPPAFGSLLPQAAGPAPFAGIARDRRSGRRLGTFSAGLVPDAVGTLSVYTLQLEGGTVVALGPSNGRKLTVSGGSGRFGGATGTMTINQVGSRSGLDLDVELAL